MGKRVSNRKGSGGARARRTWARRNFKIARRRERRAEDERQRMAREIAERNARIAERVSKRKPGVFARIKNFITRRT